MNLVFFRPFCHLFKYLSLLFNITKITKFEKLIWHFRKHLSTLFMKYILTSLKHHKIVGTFLFEKLKKREKTEKVIKIFSLDAHYFRIFRNLFYFLKLLLHKCQEKTKSVLFKVVTEILLTISNDGLHVALTLLFAI